MQLSTSHKNQKTAERYTGKLPFKRMILTHTGRYNAHPRAHWVLGLKKYWQHHRYQLCQIIADALKRDDKGDCMNVEPLLPHSDAILYLCPDEKVSVPVGRSVPLASVTKQSFRAIVG